MTTVVLATVRMLEFRDGGGHFWVYMQYAEGLRRQGCDVYVLDSFTGRHGADPDPGSLDLFLERMAAHGLRDRAIVAIEGSDGEPARYLRLPNGDACDLFRSADLLLDFNYRLGEDVVSLFRRSALVDIDPGLLQHWIGRGWLIPAAHDVYFTTGDTVAPVGFDWVTIRPPVCLEAWPSTYRPDADAFTTVSSWWGHREYVATEDGFFDNNKRTSYLRFVDLPAHTAQPLELALYLAEADEEDRRLLENHGWRVRHSREVAGSPEAYQRYIQGSRGELGCAKPSCAHFGNAWVSDRSLCYLASGKPIVVEHTGPSSYLPEGRGLFRFRTIAEAVAALEAINADYEAHCRYARELAEEHFDAQAITRGILERAL
jgi:glycosyltransferase involved in cell wall biosynthesis